MSRWALRVASAGMAASLALGLSCGKHSGPTRADAAVTVKQGASSYEVAEELFQGGLKNHWQDYGWAPRQIAGGGPAELHFANWNGWIIAKPNLKPGPWAALVSHVKAPAGFGDFLEVRLDSAQQNLFLGCG